jgi:hypothetical protein
VTVRETDRRAYQRELVSAAKRLGIPAHGDIETALIQHALENIRAWIAAHRRPANLTDLLQKIAVSFAVEIVEIHDDEDIHALLSRIPPGREPVLARLADELDDNTDAVILQRQNREAWEMPFLAAINCRGWHRSRSYFSKWHEVIHLLLDGKQLRFAFRKTNAKKKHPEEILVDKIAGVLGFHPDLFQPVLSRELARAGRLTFDVVECVRAEIAPDASRESTLYACLRNSGDPVYFISARLGYKRAETRQLDDLLSGLSDTNAPQARLRVRLASASPAVQSLGIRIHENMQVPEASIVAEAFTRSERSLQGREALDIWRTSEGGPIGSGDIEVEASRRGDEVWCLLHFLPSTRGSRAVGENATAGRKEGPS